MGDDIDGAAAEQGLDQPQDGQEDQRAQEGPQGEGATNVQTNVHPRRVCGHLDEGDGQPDRLVRADKGVRTFFRT